MDYALTAEQQAVVDSVATIVRQHGDIPHGQRSGFAQFGGDLRHALDAAGFLDLETEMGALEAALALSEIGSALVATDCGAAMLVAPRVMGRRPAGVVAIGERRGLGRAIRNLPVAEVLLLDDGGDVLAGAVSRRDVKDVETVLAYPYGRFGTQPDVARMERFRGAGPALRQWQRVAIAAECAGTMAAAVAFTLEHVKQRVVLGRPVGAFQSVQHRLAQCHQITMATRYLALKAAWSGAEQDAAIASCYAQQKISRVVFDLHQFNGAMGVTNAYSLHYWTYRLRALQAEAGGAYGAAEDISSALWGGDRGGEAHP